MDKGRKFVDKGRKFVDKGQNNLCPRISALVHDFPALVNDVSSPCPRIPALVDELPAPGSTTTREPPIVLVDAHEDLVMDCLEEMRLKSRAKLAALLAQSVAEGHYAFDQEPASGAEAVYNAEVLVLSTNFRPSSKNVLPSREPQGF